MMQKNVMMQKWAKAALAGSMILAGSALAAGTRAQAKGPEAVPGEVLVAMRPQAFDGHHVRAMAERFGRVTGGQNALHTVRLRLQPGLALSDALAQLRQRTDVLYVEPNYVMHVQATPDDPYYAAYQYAPQITQADKAWGLWTPHAPIVIAIVDTGIDTSHPDLTNKIDRDSAGNVVGYDFVHNVTGAEDDNGHGTHCAGIAAAQTDSGIGIAGVAAWNGVAGTTDTQDIKVMPVKVMDSTGSGSEADIADGIVWAADHGAKVISLSLGGPQDSQTLESAIQYAWGKGCLLVAAAGNSAATALSYPAACAHVLSVAATDSTDTLASYSNYGPWVQVAAPGSQILSTWLGGQFAWASGTSMACPYVAGEAALIWSDVPTLSNDKLSGVLKSNVDPVQPYQGHAIAPGAGRVNVYKALQAALGGSGTTSATPPANAAPVANPVISLTLDSSSIKGGQSAHLTVMLAAPAASGGETVTVGDSGGGQSASAHFTVPTGKTSLVLTLMTVSVRQTTTYTLTTSAQGGTKTATLTVLPPAVRAFALSAAQVTGGGSVTGTVVLDGPAPSGGFPVPLGCSAPSATVPATVTIPAGSASATYFVHTQAVTRTTTVTLTASGSAPKTATLTLLPMAGRR